MVDVTNKQPRIIYFGTPELAVEPLQTLLQTNTYKICAVVTQTDKPAGRGQQLAPTPLKRFALENGLRVLQPTNLKKISREGEALSLPEGTEATREFVEFLNAHQPFDAFIVVAYGKIIPATLLHYPRHGILNIHIS